MKAISLWQPWAALMAVDAKKIETRHWPTSYRGELAIHAAKRHADMEYLGECPAAANALSREGMWYGAIVAVVTLYDCRRSEDLKRDLPDWVGAEENFGNFEDGRFGWMTKDLRKLRQPVYVRGRQALWTLTAEEEQQVRAQMA